MDRNTKVIVLVAAIFLAIVLVSWFFRHWGMVGIGIGGFIFGYFVGRKNK